MIISPTEPLSPRPLSAFSARAAAVLAGIALLLYGYALGAVTPSAESVTVLQHARNPTPQLFFHVADQRWLQPLGVYATAMLDTLGAGDRSPHIASAVAGAVNVALIVIVARMAGARDAVAIALGLLLMLTPAHRALARLGTDAILPIAFVLAWLIGVLRFLRTDSAASLAAAGLALGIGIYSHHTAPLTMVGLAAATVATLIAGHRRPQAVGAFAAVFALCLLPAAIWFARYPDSYADTFGRWVVFKAHVRFPLDGLRAQVNWNTLGNRASIVWGYLDPSFLFFAPRAGGVAPFPVCFALLVPLGIHWLSTAAERRTRLLMWSTVVIPVLVGSTFGQPQTLTEVSTFVAALTLLAGYGVASLHARPRPWTWAAAVLAIASLWQVASAAY